MYEAGTKTQGRNVKQTHLEEVQITEARAVAARGYLPFTKSSAGNPRNRLNLRHAMPIRRYLIVGSN